MAKIVLNDISGTNSPSTSAATINNNNNSIEVSMENTLSRDGTSPNQMAASLDMNSNQILNLPAPISANEPLRLKELTDFTGTGSILLNALPVGGTVNQILTKDSSSNFDASWHTLVAPSIVLTPQQFGAVGDGVANDTTAMQNAINAAIAAGLELYIPGGRYLITSSLTINNGIKIRGSGVFGYLTFPAANGKIGTVLKMANGINGIVVTTINPVCFEDFQIEYSAAQVSGSAITINAAGGSPLVVNSDSTFRNIFILSAFRGWDIVRGPRFVMHGCRSEGHIQIGLAYQFAEAADSGDWAMSDCLWSSAATVGHVFIQSGGGHKITNCKMNGASPFGVLWQQVDNGVASSVDLAISNCSMESQNQNIFIQRSAGAIAAGRSMANCNITGCQLLGVANNIIIANDTAAPTPFFEQFIAVGNVLQVTSASAKSISLSQTNGGSITGNTFQGPGGSNATQIVNGSTNITVSGSAHHGGIVA